MPLDPEEFARLVSVEMLRLRGWRDPKSVTPEVRGDVHKTMGEDPDYTRMWISGTSPADTARAIQYRAWDGTSR
jgi:hypothetical protein